MLNTIQTTTGSSQTDNPIWAVVVVHGVGDTAPGATLGALIPTVVQMQEGSLEEVEAPQNRLLVEPPATAPSKIPVASSDPATETLRSVSERFPMHLRQFRVACPRPGQPNQAAFAEVFWADLTAASEARSERLVKRLFRLIFDLRHIPNVAAAYPHLRFAGLLRWMFYVASWLLIGPIAGMTLFMVYLLGAYYVAVLLFALWPFATPTSASEIGLGCLGVGAVLASLLGTRYLNPEGDETWSLLSAWFGVAGSVIVIVGIGRVLAMPPWPWNTPIGEQVAKRLLDRPDLGMTSLATHVAVLFAMIYAGFVLLAFVMTLAFCLWFLARNVASCRHEKSARPALDAALGTTLLQVELFVVTAAALGWLVLSWVYPDPNPSKHPLFTMMVTAFTLKCIFAMIIALCGAAVWWWRKLTITKSLHTTTAAAVQAPELPRLLVHPYIMYPLISLTLFALVSFAYAVCTGDSRFHRMVLYDYSRFVLPITVPVIILVGLFFRKGLGSWLHIMADITNHFYRPRLPSPWPWKRIEHTNPEVYARQQRTAARFRRVLEEVLRLGNVTHVTIVAHSQGTMTAIDALRLEWAATLLAGKELYLITMGSPFTNLYQYYFPHRYPPLFTIGSQCTEAWGPSLRQTIRVWTNIYRIDDFIGNRIDGDSSSQFPSNHCLAAGGHTGYWQQRDSTQFMLPYLPGCWPTPIAGWDANEALRHVTRGA